VICLHIATSGRHADDVDSLGENIDTIQKNAVNAEKTKYMVTSHKKARQKHSIQIANRSFEVVGKFKYLVTTLTDQNSMQEETDSGLISGNACYHSVQSLLSSRLLSRNVKVKIYKTIILAVVFMGVKLGLSY
jgi:hypothetical protein